jgi:hypothetical protein
MLRTVKGAIYADDLVLWCSEEKIEVARSHIQNALDKLQSWIKNWLVSVNAFKTVYTIFSLSTKPQKAKLTLNGQTLTYNDL